MYKILLVDDEKLVIKSLMATVNWMEYGFEIIDYALSAEEAFEKVKKLKPEVVFTDIKMPKINGLELLQMIKTICPNIYCVVISGYAEFAYIQKSIRLEAVGYCLKPFDPDEISVYLKRIKKHLDKSQLDEEKTSIILDYLQSSSTEAISFMKKIYEKKGINFEKTKTYVMYTTGIDKISYVNSLLTVRAGYLKYICFINEEELNRIMKEFADHNEDENLSPVRMGISKPIVSSDKIAKAIREAKNGVYQYFCQKDCGIVVKSPNSTKDVYLLKTLERELEYNDVNQIRKCITEISDKFIQGEYNIDHAICLQNSYATWIGNIYKSSDVELIYEYEALCEMYPSIYDLLMQIENDIYDLNQNLDNNCQNSISNKTFLTIFHYIENNYTKPISVAALSEQFHINVCYFSQLFKKEMGCTFTDYLSKKRIEYASKLLLETDLKINEIAEMSGFGDYFYFSRVYRRIKRCSPTEYRMDYNKI